jgi:hypothetical protein
MLPLLILVIIDLMILMRTGATPVEAPGDGGMWTVLGSMGCGWTRKQLDHMKKNGIAHKFVDCDKEKCDAEAFPTLIDSNGEKHVGYKEI